VRRLLIAAALTAMSCASGLAQQIDYSQLEIGTTDLGHGVYLLNCARRPQGIP